MGQSFVYEKFRKVIHLKHGGVGAGKSYDDALPIASGDLMTIEAGMVIEKVYAVVDVAVTGSTDIDVGDDDDSDGFIDGSLSLTLGTPGMYSWNAKVAGAYMRVQTAGATDALDIYVVPNAKYYSAAGKEVKAAVTGASTAGQVRVIVEGMKLKPAS